MVNPTLCVPGCFTYCHFLYNFFSYLTESKIENNRTECYLGQDNNSLLVYKVESSSSAREEDTVRKIAIERQGATEVEVQVWKTVEGKQYECPSLSSVAEYCNVMESAIMYNLAQFGIIPPPSHRLPEIKGRAADKKKSKQCRWKCRLHWYWWQYILHLSYDVYLKMILWTRVLSFAAITWRFGQRFWLPLVSALCSDIILNWASVHWNLIAVLQYSNSIMFLMLI